MEMTRTLTGTAEVEKQQGYRETGRLEYEGCNKTADRSGVNTYMPQTYK